MELPELWNVLGATSRLLWVAAAARPRTGVLAVTALRAQARRHDVRPGITGLAQVSGRNAISWEEKFALDVRYVDEHDLRMDLGILVRTVGAVLSRAGIRYGEGVDMPEFLGSEAMAPTASHRA